MENDKDKKFNEEMRDFMVHLIIELNELWIPMEHNFVRQKEAKKVRRVAEKAVKLYFKHWE